jgi:excisionase family DNA binding protein
MVKAVGAFAMTISVDSDVAFPRCYTIEAVTKILSVGRSTIYEHMGTGQLKSFRLGKKRLIHEEDLQAFVNAKRQAA